MDQVPLIAPEKWIWHGTVTDGLGGVERTEFGIPEAKSKDSFPTKSGWRVPEGAEEKMDCEFYDSPTGEARGPVGVLFGRVIGRPRPQDHSYHYDETHAVVQDLYFRNRVKWIDQHRSGCKTRAYGVCCQIGWPLGVNLADKGQPMGCITGGFGNANLKTGLKHSPMTDSFLLGRIGVGWTTLHGYRFWMKRIVVDADTGCRYQIWTRAEGRLPRNCPGKEGSAETLGYFSQRKRVNNDAGQA